MSTVDHHGYVAPGFKKVADAFVGNFTDRGDTGAACSVYIGGELVVDLWGGTAGSAPWTRDTHNVQFSVSKGITTICLLMAGEADLLRLDAPVVEYWPEFAAHGKDALTVRQLLAHRGGLPAPDRPLTIEDLRAWSPVADALAAQAPLWPPGTAYAYHPLTMGWLAGEVLRRATGMRPGEWIREHITGPLALAATFGADPDDPDFAWYEGPVSSQQSAANGTDPLLVRRAVNMNGAFGGADIFANANSTDFLTCEIPAANLVSTAHHVARLYAATVSTIDGVRILQPHTVRDARAPLSAGVPYVGPDDGNRWGTGFMIDSARRRMAGPGSFGHDGAAGQLAFANLEHELAFAYQTNRPGGMTDDRAEQLCEAVRACL